MSDEALQRTVETAATKATPVLSGRRLKEMAASGGFAVEGSAGDRMIQALQGAIDSLESRWANLQKLGQNPPMSDTPTARWVAQHMVDTASDEQGLLTQLNAARTEFPAYIEAINLAKRNYEEHDASVSESIHRIDRQGA